MRSTERRWGARLLACALLAGLGACATQPQPRAGVSAAATSEAAAIPAGRTLHAHLDGGISSETAHPGEPFTATLDEPLVAVDGSARVPRGSKLHGRVLGVEGDGVGRLTLQLDALEVEGRLLPIAARIVRIEGLRVVTIRAPGASVLTAYVYPAQASPPTPTAIGGGPQAETLPVEIGAGASLELVLTRPFAPLPAVRATPTPAPTSEHVEPRIEGL